MPHLVARGGVLLLLALSCIPASTASVGRLPPPPLPSSAVSPPPLRDGQPLVLLQGRFHPGPGPGSQLARLPQLMTWSGSTATVTFTGSTHVTVVVKGSLAALPEPDQPMAQVKGGFPWCFFQLELNGAVVGTRDTSTSRPVLKWRLTGLSSNKTYVLKITKTTEAKFGAAWLSSISLQGSGSFLPPPVPPAVQSGRRILFLGDSYTAGYANLGDASCSKPNSANWENSLLAYPALTAGALGADYQAVAWSGSALTLYASMDRLEWPAELRPRANPKTSDLFIRADALDPASRYNLSSWVPQVVVLAAGVNDMEGLRLTASGRVRSTSPYALPSEHVWLQRYLAFAKQVRRAYPAAALVHVVWPSEVPLGGVLTRDEATIYQRYMAAAYEHLEAAGIGNQSLFEVDGAGLDSRKWCGHHPDAATHAQVADQLSDFLSTVLE